MPSDSRLLLIADDFEGIQYPYRYLLTQEGFRMEFATYGQDTVDKALALQPDVIFMDVSLPVFDGWKATRRLRTDERTKRTPVVMLTAFGLESARGHVVEADFDGMLSKPRTPDKIHAEVDRVLACR
jgi:two-component system cell cycle response regulator DivK